MNTDPVTLAEGGLPDLIRELVAANFQAEIQYYARIPFDPDDRELKIGLGGQARIWTGYRSLGSRLYRWFNQNFRS
jgi:hypothetical protein